MRNGVEYVLHINLGYKSTKTQMEPILCRRRNSNRKNL